VLRINIWALARSWRVSDQSAAQSLECCRRRERRSRICRSFSRAAALTPVYDNNFSHCKGWPLLHSLRPHTMQKSDRTRSRSPSDVSRQLFLLRPENGSIHTGWKCCAASAGEADCKTRSRTHAKGRSQRLMDRVSKAVRSQNMSRIRSKDTSPELIVRRLVHIAGFRYRLHVRTLPGRPDLVFPRLHKAIFVHGCFWHRHSCKNGQVVPATRTDFWQAKFEANVTRDRKARRQLRRAGWDVLVVWECATRASDLGCLRDKLIGFLNS